MFSNRMRKETVLTKPFPVVVLKDVFEPEIYEELARTFPPAEALAPLDYVGEKLNLQDRYEGFTAALADRPLWREFWEFTQSRQFRNAIFHHCADFEKLLANIKFRFKENPRFEFSGLPAEGGHINPHTDIPKKIITMVIYFPQPDWKEEWGGQFEVLRHRERPEDDLDRLWPKWDEVETVTAVPFRPNRLVIMRKTPNSLHGVRPIKGPAGIIRRTITINFFAKPRKWLPLASKQSEE